MRGLSLKIDPADVRHRILAHDVCGRLILVNAIGLLRCLTKLRGAQATRL